MAIQLAIKESWVCFIIAIWINCVFHPQAMMLFFLWNLVANLRLLWFFWSQKREVKSQMRAYQSQCRALTTVLIGSWLIRACTAVFVCVELGTVCRFPGAVCFWGAAMVVSFLLAVNKSTDMFVWWVLLMSNRIVSLRAGCQQKKPQAQLNKLKSRILFTIISKQWYLFSSTLLQFWSMVVIRVCVTELPFAIFVISHIVIAAYHAWRCFQMKVIEQLLVLWFKIARVDWY